MIETLIGDPIKLTYTLLESADDNVLRIRGRFQLADALNSNGRIYPAKLFKVINDKSGYVQEAIKSRSMTGLLEHPNNGQTHLAGHFGEGVSHVITHLEFDGKEVIGEYEVLDTPSGKLLKEYIEKGLGIGVSSRCKGKVVTDKEGNKVVQEDGFQIGTWDVVSNPSVKSAKPSQVVESDETPAEIDNNSEESVSSKIEDTSSSKSSVKESEEYPVVSKLNDLKALETDLKVYLESDVESLSSVDRAKIAQSLRESTVEINRVSSEDSTVFDYAAGILESVKAKVEELETYVESEGSDDEVEELQVKLEAVEIKYDNLKKLTECLIDKGREYKVLSESTSSELESYKILSEGLLAKARELKGYETLSEGLLAKARELKEEVSKGEAASKLAEGLVQKAKDLKLEAETAVKELGDFKLQVEAEELKGYKESIAKVHPAIQQESHKAILDMLESAETKEAADEVVAKFSGLLSESSSAPEATSGSRTEGSLPGDSEGLNESNDSYSSESTLTESEKAARAYPAVSKLQRLLRTTNK